MMLTVVLGIGAAGAAVTLAMTLLNLRRYRSPDEAGTSDALVTVCIPARNEEDNIAACVRSLLAGDHRALEVLVYDDESTDRTPAILETLMAEDTRVRGVPTRPLPAGWNGKQHACHRMSEAARGDWLLFTDADVRFAPDAVRRAVAHAERSDAPLVSTFPRQIVGTFGELLLVPSMFFILFSYLPFGLMQRTTDPKASAGCGQFLLARAGAYREIGGHTVCRGSMHDGIMIPRAFRRAGLWTDLFDGTGIVSVRMYRGFGESWRGFVKNAYEGLGSVGLLLFMTVFHLVAHVGPWAILPAALLAGASRTVLLLAGAAVLLNCLQRVVLAHRFRHSLLLAFLHPLSVVLMTGVQWHSFAVHLSGRRTWRGRTTSEAAPVGERGTDSELDEPGFSPDHIAARDG